MKRPSRYPKPALVAWIALLGLANSSVGLVDSTAIHLSSEDEVELLQTLAKVETELQQTPPKESRRRLQGLLVPEHLRDEWYRLRAWTYYLDHNSGAGLAELKAMAHHPSDATFLKAAYQLREGQGDAARALKEIWLNATNTGFALHALRELALSKQVQHYSPLENTVIKKLTASLSAAKPQPMTKAALLSLRASIPHDRKLWLEASQNLAALHILRQKFTEAIKVGQRGLKECLSAEDCAVFHYRLGEALRHQGRQKLAEKHFRNAARAKVFAWPAFAALGKMASDRRDYQLAIQTFNAMLLENPVAKERPSALWGLGWAHFRRGQFPIARQYFESLQNESPLGSMSAKARYWGARALDEMGRGSEAIQEYTQLASLYPSDYYAYRARQSLGVVEITPSRLPDTEALLDTAKAEQISRLAQSSLKHELKTLIKNTDLDSEGPKTLKVIARLASKHGLHTHAERAKYRKNTKFPSTKTKKTLRKRYPQSIHRWLKSHGEMRRLNMPLAMGLIRQESAFNARATSASGAIGLMQLMPPTAQGLWEELWAKRPFTKEAIYEPTTNLKLGTRYLGRMLRAFRGRREYALAAYNAGPGSVTRWRARQGDLPADIFVEEIPYAETQDYVKKVIAWGESYRFAFSPSPAKKAVVAQK